MATYTKRDGRWRAQIRLKGWPPESETFAAKSIARAWATKREAEINAGRRGEIIPRSVRAGLKQYAVEVAPKHRGARWEKVRLTKLERELDFIDRQLEEVRGADLVAWREASLRKLKGASVRREMVLLRSVFEACKEWGWLSVNPLDGIKYPPHSKARDRRVSEAEIEALRTAAGYEGGKPTKTVHRVVLAFLLALETGMRAGEICGLRPENVDTDGRFCTLSKTKNGDARAVPLSTAAIALLELVPKGFELKSHTLDVVFRGLCKKAGITGLHFHDSRHEAITRLSRKLDVLDLARMVGTRDLKSLMHYYNPTPAEIAARLG